MEKNIETECKVLLNSEDYEKIYDFFQLDKKVPIKQINYYFDTNNMNLYYNKFNLRVRHILDEDCYILTVKIPEKEGSNLEINQEITYSEFKDLIEKHYIPKGYINERINEINKDPIYLLTHLITTRYEFEYKLGLIALDYNEYNNKYDYELEFEGKSMEYCKNTITSLLDKLSIDFEFSNISKRKRAIESRV